MKTRHFLDGFRRPKGGRWRLDWRPFISPVPDAPNLHVPWKALGTLSLFTVLGVLLPWDWAALYFLPLFGMAWTPINVGAAANDGTGTNWRLIWQRINDYNASLDALQSRIVNAGDIRFEGEATTEAKIEAACVQAEAELATIVAIPANMLPYDTSLVGAHPTIRRVREGGNYAVYDVRAYGADPLGVLDATDEFNAIPVTEETYVSQGTYLIGGTLTKTRMTGDGPTSILLLKPSASLTSFQSPGTEAITPIITNPTHTGSDDTGIRFSRFAIDGNSANQSHNQGMAGIYLRNVTDALLIDVEVDDITPDSMVTHSKQSFCFMALESSQIHIRGGRYTNAGYECVGFRNDVHHSSIADAYTGSGGVHSIQVASGTDFGSSAVEPTNITITGNVVRHQDGRNQGAGIIVHTGDIVCITGNSVLSQHVGDTLTVTGIIVDGADGVVVSGNVVTSTGVAMNIRNAPANLAITGNYFQAFVTGAASFSVAALHMSQTVGGQLPSNVTITGNVLKPPTNGIGLRLRGTKIHVADNVVPQALRCIFVEGTTTETSDVVIVDNDLTTTNGSGCFGIQVTQNASRVRLRSNVIRGLHSTTQGIALADTCDDIELTDNDLRGIITAANQLVITTSGTNITRRGNRFTNGAARARLVLVNGTVTWSTTEILTGDNVSLTRVVGAGTTRGILTLGTITDRTSVVVRSEDLAGALSADDDSTVFAEIVH